MAANGLGALQADAERLERQGKLDEAEALLREALAGRPAQLGPAHADTLASTAALGKLLWKMGRNEEAEPLCRAALEGRLAGWRRRRWRSRRSSR